MRVAGLPGTLAVFDDPKDGLGRSLVEAHAWRQLAIARLLRLVVVHVKDAQANVLSNHSSVIKHSKTGHHLPY